MPQTRHSTLFLSISAIATAAAPNASAQIFGVEGRFDRVDAAGGTLAVTVFPNGPRELQRIGGVGFFEGETVAFVTQNASANGLISSGQPGQTFDVDADFIDFLAAGIDEGGFEIPGSIPSDSQGLFFGDALNDGVFRFNPTTGITPVLTETQIAAFTGESGASLGLGQAILPSGQLLFFESRSDGLLITDGTSGDIADFATQADFEASPIANFVDDPLDPASLDDAADVDGFTIAGTDFFHGNGTLDRVFRLDLTASDPLGSATEALSPTDIEAVTGNASINFSAGFVTGGDGFVYFYENVSDSILRFNPSDPSGTLISVLSDTELSASVAGTDILTGLVPTAGGAGFYTTRLDNGTNAFFEITVIPEPATAGLVGIASLGLLRRRR
ncbi:MAG: PEP-CTERM sorting domain-containing protein [Planctomycetota bacterium]